MRVRIILCFFLMFGVSAIPVMASDICTMASRAATMTAEQMDNFNEDQIRGNSFSGSGTIRRFTFNDVDEDEAYTITVDCGNKVLVTLYADEMFGKSNTIENGATISFSGKATELRRHFPDGVMVFIKEVR